MLPKNILIPLKEIKELQRNLTDEQLGAVISMVIDYYQGNNIEDVEKDRDLITKISFSSLKPKIDYDIDKYKKQVEANRINGKKGGRPKNGVSNNSKKPKEEIKKEIEKPKTKSTPKRKYGEFGKVKLTDDEKNRLVSELGAVKFDACVKVLDEYKETSGKKYNNDNLVIRKWVIEKVNKEFNKSNITVKDLDIDYSDF